MALAGIAVDLYSRYSDTNPTTGMAQSRSLRAFVWPCLGHAVFAAPPGRIRSTAGAVRRFRQWGSKTPGIPNTASHGCGHQYRTVGTGMGNAVGLALASKMMALA